MSYFRCLEVMSVKHAIRAELLQTWMMDYKIQHRNVPGLLLRSRSVQDEIIKLQGEGEGERAWGIAIISAIPHKITQTIFWQHKLT